MSDQKKSALAEVEKIEGWLTIGEAGLLYDLASQASGPIVEIGCWRGRSTTALGLGSMSGNKQPIYAVDSFIGVPPTDRQTSKGNQPGWKSSSPEILLAHLDGAGVNGLVRIVPKASEIAAPEIPECDLLFVDGSHDYLSVKRDLSLYLPKIRMKGKVVLHDVKESDPGVVQAVDEILTANPDKWRCRTRMDSALVFERRNTTRHCVLLGFPGNSLCYGAHQGLKEATLGCHDVYEEQSAMGWDDMARLWVWALNQAAKGKYTHFAMLHSDIQPSPGWIDLLMDELDDRDGDMISAIAALKNNDGVTSCGIGDKDNPWAPFRRFTMRELMKMPETFGIEDTPHPDRYLLHNSGCILIDLRKRLWRAVDDAGVLVANFAFPIRAKLQPNGEFEHERESEDWYFSRQIAKLGAKTFVTRRATTLHFGQHGYRNDMTWGKWEHDKATEHKWGIECQHTGKC